jgi:uncharacterized NAD(P)/FAD-binding protein YdhS
VIAIIGGGASGALTALQLLRQAARQRLGLRIDLIDRHGRHGLGQAYSTGHDAHLLNTAAGQMSALPDDPDHLIRWAGGSGEAFLPRGRYGQYLRETLAQAQRQAQPHAQLARITSDVTSLTRPQTGRAIRLKLADGWLDADVAVLALGATTAGLPFEAPASSRIIADPWRPGALDEIRDNRPVVIVGTGLTMVDLAIAINGQSPGSTIYAASRHGLLPRSHPASPVPNGPRPGPLPGPAAPGQPAQVRLTELMAQVRAAVAADPARWHEVVGAIRPAVPELWHGLPEGDKRLFLRHVARYWEIHRHLMPPATAARLDALRQAGRLTVTAGRITGVVEANGQFLVRIGSGDGSGADARELTAGWIINAAGAATDIRYAADPLLTSLLATGMARPDPLRLGLDATADGALIDASGAASDVLHTLGPPLRGLWYETTAIPEIRSQAAALAERITAGGRLRGQRESAA